MGKLTLAPANMRERWQAAIDKAIAAERERCAKIADSEKYECAMNGHKHSDLTIGQIGAASRIAASIRSQTR